MADGDIRFCGCLLFTMLRRLGDLSRTMLTPGHQALSSSFNVRIPDIFGALPGLGAGSSYTVLCIALNNERAVISTLGPLSFNSRYTGIHALGSQTIAPHNELNCPSRESLTATTARAKALLFRLPAEVLFHFWGILLRNASLEDFNTVLRCVPSWSVGVITDNVQRCSLMCSSSVPHVQSLRDFEKESKFNVGRLVRRVAVLFDCDKATLTGHLNAYEGCRYARLFVSPLVDASYCLVAPHGAVNRNYTEELLFQFQSLATASSGRLDIVKHSEPLDSVGEGFDENGSGDSHHTTRTLRSEDKEVLGQSVSFSDKCTTTDNGRECVNPVLNPVLSLAPEGLAPHLHVSFRGSRIPMVYKTGLWYLGKLDAELRKYSHLAKKESFSVVNLNWSLSTPHGASPLCEHVDSFSWVVGDRHDQEGFNSLNITISGGLAFVSLYKRVWIYGLPDAAVLQIWDFLLNTEEFVWFRLTTHNHPDHFVVRWSWAPELCSDALTRFALFTELRQEMYYDRKRLPELRRREDMDCVQLVALEKSDMVWNVNKIILRDRLQTLRTLEILQLRRSTDKAPSGFLEMGWETLSTPTHIVQELTIGGYFPAFALSQSQHSTTLAFHKLELLCLDISALIHWETPETVAWYELCFPERLFPKLCHLYLKGTVAILRVMSYPKLTLTKTCTTLDLSAVIRTKARINDKLLRIPEIPVLADTFNRWVLKEMGNYVYEGKGEDTFTRRIEVVDESLRAI